MIKRQAYYPPGTVLKWIPRELFLLLVGALMNMLCFAQPYDLLIKNAHMIDPKNHINGKMDLAVTNGMISKVAKEIPAMQSKKTIDAGGLYIVPGLIDMHTHVFVGPEPEKFADGQYSVSPDDFSFRSGVTTVVDAGTSGWHNFPQFKGQVIDHMKTRVLAFLNINANGLSGKPDEEDVTKMIVDSAVQMQKKFPGIIVGIKIGHYEGSDWTPFDRALEAAAITHTPLFVECHLPKYSLQDQLHKMRPGDIITHSYEQIPERMAVVDEAGKLRPFVLEAKQKGILFDLGHGGAGFWFSQAIPAFKQGLAPNSFGSDLHRFSMNAGMKSMTNIMSKYMAIGMPLEDAIVRATWNPALSIHRPDLGNLSEGTVADITLLRVLNGRFGYMDAGGYKLEGNQKLEAELTIRAGKIEWDLNGLAAREIYHEK
ncbi:amidohydrolase/deacetylase family metallohydrolase [Flavihumibacter profundi]|uniref:amidohydrolase/deacetylase family metallohydrolase n=1 Tax=Flavihumibacter profundi TaxID=2716883 RepID=UPI001CC66B92|nr:amidohydrolase/deacetylase family metallohydrolase [Flavihumibacter profundi]MBZ5859321.1 amidohydrolase/deacetylase family metallohydrolase [Flavihumibacter profundi]